MRLTFDYPVTRSYPWRFTTLLIIGVSIIVLGLLAYINLAVVGMTTYARNSFEFTKWRQPSRMDQLDLSSMINYTIGCESSTLVTGGTYQTSNGAFAYTIQSLYDQNSQKRTSDANYSGSALDTCVVDTINMSTDFSAHEATFEATINCSFPGELEVILTTNTVTSAPFEGSTQGIDSRSTALAQNASSLLAAVGFDYFYVAILVDGEMEYNGVMAPVTNLKIPFRLYQNSTIEWLSGSVLMTRNVIWRDPSLATLQNVTSSQIDAALKNYLRILYSAILSDLGIASNSNVMTDIELFERVMQPIDFSFRGEATSWSGNTSKVDTILADMSSYGLPFTSVEPTELSVPYLCLYRGWKAYTNLITDVYVATASFFGVFWGAVKVVLAFFAQRKSIDGSNCPCENCKIIPRTNQCRVSLPSKEKSTYNRVPDEEP